MYSFLSVKILFFMIHMHILLKLSMFRAENYDGYDAVHDPFLLRQQRCVCVCYCWVHPSTQPLRSRVISLNPRLPSPIGYTHFTYISIHLSIYPLPSLPTYLPHWVLSSPYIYVLTYLPLCLPNYLYQSYCSFTPLYRYNASLLTYICSLFLLLFFPFTTHSLPTSYL